MEFWQYEANGLRFVIFTSKARRNSQRTCRATVLANPLRVPFNAESITPLSNHALDNEYTDGST